MFLGIPGIRNITSGMTQKGEKMSYTVFDTLAKLEAAKEPISMRLAEMGDPAGKLLEANDVARCITDAE